MREFTCSWYTSRRLDLLLFSQLIFVVTVGQDLGAVVAGILSRVVVGK